MLSTTTSCKMLPSLFSFIAAAACHMHMQDSTVKRQRLLECWLPNPMALGKKAKAGTLMAELNRTTSWLLLHAETHALKHVDQIEDPPAMLLL